MYYHAHVYYKPNEMDGDRYQRTRAEMLCKKLSDICPDDVKFGRFHDRPVGPHTSPMFQIIFSSKDFSTIVEKLMLERRGLSVLIHPETGDEVADHTDHALWLGTPLPLNMDKLA